MSDFDYYLKGLYFELRDLKRDRLTMSDEDFMEAISKILFETFDAGYGIGRAEGDYL
jgi:hypothetical protein